MLEKYLQQRKEELLDKISTESADIFIRDIVATAGIEKPYKTYFDAEADWWIYEERVLRRTHPNFDLNDEESRSVINELDQLLRKKARISKSEIGFMAQDAVKARMNFLVRPRTTLKWFIFRGEPTKPFVEIIKRMNYFYDYKYFYDGLLKWAEDKGLDKNSDRLISIDEFSRVIDNIDNNQIYDLSLEEFADILDPMFEFFREKDENGTALIPIESLILFLDDKGVNPLASALENKRREDDVKFLSREQIIDFYNSILNEYDRPGAEKPTTSEIPSETDESEMETAADLAAGEPQPMDIPESEEEIAEVETSGEAPEISEKPAENAEETEEAKIPSETDESEMETAADLAAVEPQPMDIPESEEEIAEVETSGEAPEISEKPAENAEETEEAEIPSETDESEMETATDLAADEPQPMDIPESEEEIAEVETSGEASEESEEVAAELTEEQGPEHVEGSDEIIDQAADTDLENIEEMAAAESEGDGDTEKGDEIDDLINKIEGLPETDEQKYDQQASEEVLSEIEELNASMEESGDEKKKDDQAIDDTQDTESGEDKEVLDNIDDLLEEDMNDEDIPEVTESEESPGMEPDIDEKKEEKEEDSEEEVNYIAELKELFGNMPEDKLKSENVDETTRAFQESFMNMLHYDKHEKFVYNSPDFPTDILDSEIINPEERDSGEDDDDDDDLDNLASGIK